jgi:serine protease Do
MGQPRQPWPAQGGYDPAAGWNPQPPYQPPRQQYQPQNPTPGHWEQPAPKDPSAPPPKKKKRRVLRVLLGILLVLAGLAVLGAAGYGIFAAVTGENPLGGEKTQITTPGGLPDVKLNDKPENAKDDYSGAAAGSLSNTEIFQKVSPSVVAIIARSGASVYGGQSQGTGIIMSEDGYIITNAHLVTDRDNFEVILTNGESHRAEVVGSDRNNDLAVLKVNATGLTAAEFGNSEQTQVGERVCVIGNPGGLRFQNSLTVGYVSALNRAVYIGNYTINCIQTDAAINPGNSGGPLINAFGQVIGISSAKIALEEYEGICFAIPISEAMPILQQLISEGKVTGRAMLGITATPVKATEAEFYEIPLGLWVKGVTPGSDIARKGVREGDIITHLAGQPIYTLDACSNVLRDYAPGDTIQVTVFRREGSVTDNTFTVDVILEAS